jgi:hypothetical protein
MRSAIIAFLPQLLTQGDSDIIGQYVRVTGYVRFINAKARWCQIEDEGSFLVVDLTLADMIGLAEGRLFQFIGEITPILHPNERFAGCRDVLCLAATITRYVDDLDFPLYKKVIVARNNFLQQVAHIVVLCFI